MNILPKKWLCAMVALAAVAPAALAADVEANYEVIPLPQKVMPSRGLPFVMDGSTVIVAPKELRRNAELLAGYLNDLCGIRLRIVTKAPKKNAIVLAASLKNDNPEAYSLSVGQDVIRIDGASPAGNFYGIQTLRKSIPQTLTKGDVMVFPAVEIADAPRFGYRGAHFDTARHYFPADSIKKFIDVLALHNVNRFHWHITDDQGWRLESKKYPRLTTIGSKRAGTVLGRNTGRFDGIPYGGFYTQKEARDIVKYAADRHITVIPEIDLPGHMLGALAAYPELGCTGGPYEVWQQWGISDDVLCAGNEKTIKFLDDIMGEVMDIFPSEYIHIGGDECPKVRWQKCPKCQHKITELGLVSDKAGTAEQKLQNHVMEHVAKTLAARGRKMIGWDEILEGGLFPGATVMAWRGADAAAQSAKQGHDAILTPTSNCYFDYCQSADPTTEPLSIGGYLPVEKVYELEPVRADLTPEEAAHIIGAQANLWTEYIPTFSHALYMELPRLAAMSEVQWTAPEQKNYRNFLHRLPQLINQYRREGYNYATHVYDVDGDFIPAGNVALVLTLSTIDDAPIHYTLDGTEPTTASPIYTAPVALSQTTTVRAAAFRPEGRSREFVDSITFNKATGAKVTLANAPHKRWTANGPSTLTDGRFSPAERKSGKWLGFNGKALDATLDLGQEQTISSVAFSTLADTPAWVYDTPEVIVETSLDGTHFTRVAAESYPVASEPTIASI